MSNLQPGVNQRQSFLQRAGQIWRTLISPHSSIKAAGEYRRAQLLSILTLIILGAFLINVLFFHPQSAGIFAVLTGITLISYILGRTKYYRLGTYLFSYAFTAVGYISIYQGTASSIDRAITTTVHVSLIISSLLLSQRGFLTLVVLSTAAAFTAPFYSASATMGNENIGSTGGIVLVIGVILYGAQVYRANLEREGLKEITGANRELEDIKANLEERIGASTRELEQANQQLEQAGREVRERAARLQVISEISQEISSNVEQQLQDLLDRTARLISEKLGFYHVGVFLLDESRQYAVLRAANSAGGQHMLERRHQLKVGGTGIVGYVAQSGRPRIALDTGSDAVFFNNPDLPGTRSEMAIPLRYGTQVLGVLDIQSTMSSAFEEEDANLLGTLANQVAIAIKDVLIGEQAGGLGLRGAARHGVAINPAQKQSGYSYNADGTISSSTVAPSPVAERAIRTGETVQAYSPANTPPVLAVPVKFRGQVIGIIHVQAVEADRKWTEEEVMVVQSISDRAAFALENARLFEQTRRRAEQEKTIARITSQIGASTDFDSILQTTVEELGRTLGATRTFIQLQIPADDDASARQPVTD